MVLLVGFAACSQAAGGPGRPVRVQRVVDGDTVVLSDVGKARLIGVDTPEVYGGVECFGREASRYAKRMLASGRSVRYRPGVEARDRYGRALVYLYLGDGRELNELLVEEGYAQPLTVPPNDDRAGAYRAAARRARIAHRGLWGGSCGRAGR